MVGRDASGGTLTWGRMKDVGFLRPKWSVRASLTDGHLSSMLAAHFLAGNMRSSKNTISENVDEALCDIR
jgi:hypothetical protein